MRIHNSLLPQTQQTTTLHHLHLTPFSNNSVIIVEGKDISVNGSILVDKDKKICRQELRIAA
jgi:hypothetical protein